ncbi:IS66 family transposase [Chitinophaga oryziterrae]|uniref:IS66 family transposase n=1 Tax=Chitinophaga oryziterrae TaxID=1031224 RepID=A0A6N8J9P7_9BACT|nr:IS66 family transposase [Chitinophaga oryziterrae]MVT41843.1 IS66 family transposase [Chitinophaga oryziterrae]
MNTPVANNDYKQLYEISQKENRDLNFKLQQLQHELQQLKKMIFGSRQEKFIPSENQAAQLALDITVPAIATQAVTNTRKIEYIRTNTVEIPAVHPGRSKLPEHLRREDIILEPDHLPAGSKRIGQVETEQLECIPAELYVKRYIRPKYLLPSTDTTESNIVIADLPGQPIDKCIAGPGLLSQLVIDKYVDHLPLHRQMQRFERAGVKLPYSTISDWVAGTSRLITPLYEILVKQTLASGYLQADETPCPVLDKDKNGKTHRGFYWIYQDCINKLVVFDYQEGRNKEGPSGMLEHFKGILQTDGYGVYDDIAEKNGIMLIHCMAHARRYFIEALDSDKTRAEYALDQIQQLYIIEKNCTQQELSAEGRAQIRQEQSLPILKLLGEWMRHEYELVLPKSPISKALAYSLKRWDKLSTYVTDGRLHIDNNAVENSIRPTAIGRKNYLFAGSHEAAKRSAMLYSLLGTCKLHHINPATWLADVLSRISAYPKKNIIQLLPHNWILQQK